MRLFPGGSRLSLDKAKHLFCLLTFPVPDFLLCPALVLCCFYSEDVGHVRHVFLCADACLVTPG